MTLPVLRFLGSIMIAVVAAVLPVAAPAQVAGPAEMDPLAPPQAAAEDTAAVKKASPALLARMGARDSVTVKLVAKGQDEYLLEFQNDWLWMKSRMAGAVIEKGESAPRDEKLEKFGQLRPAARSAIEATLAAVGHTLDDVYGSRPQWRDMPRALRWDAHKKRFLLALTSSGGAGETCTRVVIDPETAQIVATNGVACRVE